MEKETVEKIKELEGRIAALEKAQAMLLSRYFPSHRTRVVDLPEEMKAKPLSELNLKDYTAQRLAVENITRLGDLAGYSKGDLLKFKKFGKKMLYDIENLYKKLGISFHYNV
jgi:DNA-directed RNA polymerase alpha subunit